MKKNNLVFHTLLALVLTLTIISVSVVFTLAFRPLYYMDISALDISEQSGYSEAEIRENYDVLIDYNLSLAKTSRSFQLLPCQNRGGFILKRFVIFLIFLNIWQLQA